MSLTDSFVKDMERRILTGEWSYGDKIPSLRELAAFYGVSRSVINAGIVELQNKGYLLTVPRRRTVVSDWKRQGTLAVMNGLIDNELYNYEIISNLLESRMTIERASAVDAAERRTDEDLYYLKEVLSEEARAVTIDERVQADVKFHHTVAVASHNIVYPLMLKSFEKIAVKLVTAFYQNNLDREFVYSRHNVIYNAIAEKNGFKAEEAMITLLKQGEEIIKRLYRK